MIHWLSMPEPERERLDSWKDIAAYLHCSEKTARRRHLLYGLPVHRMPGGTKSPVFAYRDEVDQWLRSHGTEEGILQNPAPAHGFPAPSNGRSRWIWWLVPAAMAAAAGGVLLWNSWSRPPVRLVGNPERLSHSAAAKLPPLMMDNSRIYFQEREYGQGRFRLMQMALAGGPSSVLEIPLENPDPGVVAPDGSAMLLRSIQGSKDGDEALYDQPLPAGNPRRLGDIRAYDAAWTPDRRHIIFSKLKSVYEATLEGVVTRKLFDVPGRAYGFRWAPGGKKLRFTVYDSKLSSYRIWETPSLDSAPHVASFGIDHLPQQCCGSWSPDGSLFFFQASVDGYFQVFVQPERRLFSGVGAPSAVQITSGPMNFRSPLPGREGNRLIVLSQSQKSEIVRYDAAAQRWLPLLEGVSAATAAYSKDGMWLAYTRTPDHTLWRCRMPGCRDPEQMTSAPLRVTMPRWSPDGRQIACMTQSPGKPWRASVIAVEGARLVSLLPGDGEEADPNWSPNGDKIVFGAVPNLDRGEEASIRIVDLRTQRVRTVTGSEGYHTPRWSPDGRYLAAVRSDTLELALYEFSTGKWSKLAGRRVGYPKWSADGDRIYFLAAFEKDHPQVMAVDIATRQLHSVASLSGIRRPSFSFGDWIGLGPGDTPLALRDLSTEEILSWRLERR
ncbi:MAG: PD40 domain-containing protein [Acidobacteria bacterium]|nr:PD40 domain-containing protein [Acidobacteriota bacterium]